MSPVHRDLVCEGLGATAGLVLCTAFLVRLPFLHGAQSVVFAILCIYGPIGILAIRRRPLPPFERNGRDILRGVLWYIGTSVVIFPLFLLAAHVWQMQVVGLTYRGAAGMPTFPLFLTQLLLVGLPEEFFFRGYLQSTLEMAFRRRWRILGAELGWGWIVTSLVFACAHSLILYQWWHFAIFFPALLFGFLRARTGGLIAPVGVHAISNLVIDWMGRSYG